MNKIPAPLHPFAYRVKTNLAHEKNVQFSEAYEASATAFHLQRLKTGFSPHCIAWFCKQACHMLQKQVRLNGYGWSFVCLVLLLAMPFGQPALAAESEAGAQYPQTLAGTGESRPVAELHVPAHITTEEAAHFSFDLGGYQIPAGSYTSINITVIQKPEGKKPAIRSGYPESAIHFFQSGTYVIRFVLNEIRKPSCGGVEAKELMNIERRVVVE